MIRIKEWKTKKTKVHVAYEFDHEGTTHERNTTFAIKDLNIIDKRTLYIRVRGLVMRERIKLGDSAKALKDLAGIGKAEEEGTSGSDHDKVLYSAEAHGVEDKEE